MTYRLTVMPLFRHPRVLGLAALGVAAALGLSACAQDAGPVPRGGGDTRYVAGSGTVETVPAAARKPAPRLTGTTLDGRPFDLADYRGKVVVLNVWASWCPPCRAEAPHLERVYQQTRSKGVEFVGVDTRDQKASAQAFERSFKISYPSVVDPYGELVLKFNGVLNPQAIPSTLVIDRRGRIAARALRGLTDAELHKILDPVVAETS